MNLVKDKPKRKNMNSKDKKFKKNNHSHFSFFKPKISSHKSDGKFCYISGRTNQLAPQYFHQKKKPFRTAAKGNEENFEHKINIVEQDPNNLGL